MNVSVCLFFFLLELCNQKKEKKIVLERLHKKREKETVVAKIISRDKKK